MNDIKKRLRIRAVVESAKIEYKPHENDALKLPESGELQRNLLSNIKKAHNEKTLKII